VAKFKSLNIWWVAYLIAIGEGLNFDISGLFLTLLQVFANGRIPGLPASTVKMSDAILLEVYAAVLKISDNPGECAMDVSVNVAGVAISKKIINFILSMIGAPKSKTFGGFRLGWA